MKKLLRSNLTSCSLVCLGLFAMSGFLSCSNNKVKASNPGPAPTATVVVPSGDQAPIVQGSPVPEWIKSSFRSVNISFDGTSYKITSDSIPDYNSFYFGVGNVKFVALPLGRQGNPNKIQAQGYVFNIPAVPKLIEGGKETGLGAIGVAVNGVAIFNNQAAPGDTLSSEFVTFDDGNGHPTPGGAYHYHTEPIKISVNDGKLVGFLRDGFPVYGRKEEDGKPPLYTDVCTVSNALSVRYCRPIPKRLPNFHCHPTTLFPSGVCHYHVLDSDPYISGWFAGEPGALGGGVQAAGQGGGPPAGGNNPGGGQIPQGCPQPGQPPPAMLPENCPRPF